MPEDAFQRAEDLQSLFDEMDPTKVEVVSVVWPCDNDAGIVQDYWDDQLAADSSGFAFGRALEKFRQWQIDEKNADSILCLKRINVLAHSMGNRVFRESMRVWSREILRFNPPMIFHNSFLVAADLVNETLESPRDGNLICLASRNVVVYYAADDLALRASKVANVVNAVASRRLGHTGPENPTLMPQNVYAIDCDDVNTHYDFPKGHSYFTFNGEGRSGRVAGNVFRHIADCVLKGRVEANQRDETRLKRLDG